MWELSVIHLVSSLVQMVVSEDIIRVQDSNFYQDYSYVVRVGQSINEWRDAIKSTVHPAWLECIW